MKQLHMDPEFFIVSKTDTKGVITYGNETFIKMSGYDEKELINTPHNILRHEDMPHAVFKLLWDRLKNRESINAFVKNKTKSGDFYWVYANVTPSYDKDHNVIGYYSVRRKPSQSAIDKITPIYEKLLEAERREGIDQAIEFLQKTLDSLGVSYDQFVHDLQK